MIEVNNRRELLEERAVPVMMVGDEHAPPPVARRVSWGAIFAGAVVAFSIQLLFTTLGMAIGMATVNPATEQNPAEGLAMGALIWWLATGLVSLFIGGFTAGRLAGVPRRVAGMLNGAVVWGLITVVSLYLLTTTVAGLVGGTVGTLRDGIVALGQTGAAAASGQSAPAARPRAGASPVDDRAARDSIAAETQQLAGAPDSELERMVHEWLRDPDRAASTIDRERIATVLAEQTGMSRREASDTVTRWERTLREARAELGDAAARAEGPAREIGQDAAEAVATASMWSFVGLLLGLAAAGGGGALGAPKHERRRLTQRPAPVDEPRMPRE